MATVDVILIYFGSVIELLVSIVFYVGGFVMIYSILSLFFTILFSLMKTIKLLGGVKNEK